MRDQEQFLQVLDRDEAERRFRAAIDCTPRGAEVVAEPAVPAQQARILRPRQPGTDDGHVRRARAVATMASMMPW